MTKLDYSIQLFIDANPDLRDVINSLVTEARVIDQEKGYCTLSIRGTARLLDVAHTTLISAFEGGSFSDSKIAQELMSYGFDPGSFSTNGVPDVVLGILAKYYAYKANRKTERAKLIDMLFSLKAARDFVRVLAGWEEQPQLDFSDPLQTAKLYIASEEARREAVAALAAAQPKVDFAERIQKSKRTFTIANASKILELRRPGDRKILGQNLFFKLLRDKNYLMDYPPNLNFNNVYNFGKHNSPYQQYIDQELFKLRIIQDHNGEETTQTLMTGKGLYYFHQKAIEWGYLTNSIENLREIVDNDLEKAS